MDEETTNRAWPLIPNRLEQKGLILCAVFSFAVLGLTLGTGWLGSSDTTAVDNDQRMDLNRADAGRLEELSGIGIKRARAIVSFREREGPFPSVQSLRRVPNIGPKTVEDIKPYVRLSVPKGN